MFDETAEFYDRVYAFKDYAAEAAEIARRIRAERPGASSVLDVACGTGEHAKHLAESFAIDGIDLEPAFVARAREKVPGGRFEVADMRDFDLGRTYDVVQCLFSSIGYLTDPDDVVSALRSFRRHLAPGGIVLVEPWITPKGFEPGHIGMTVVDEPDLKICRMNASSREGRMSRLHFHYLIAADGAIDHRTEVHELGLYTVEEMLSFFEAAGLAARHEEEGLIGRGLYLGQRT